MGRKQVKGQTSRQAHYQIKKRCTLGRCNEAVASPKTNSLLPFASCDMLVGQDHLRHQYTLVTITSMS